MGPVGHTVVSVGVGAGIWTTTGSVAALPAAVAAGVLPDVDHLLDYYNWYVKGDTRHLVVAFHAWEYAVVALALVLVVWQSSYLLAAAIAYLGHVVGDQVTHRPIPGLTYSIVYRAYTRFDRGPLSGAQPKSLSEMLHRRIPLWRFFEPKLVRVVARFGRQGE